MRAHLNLTPADGAGARAGDDLARVIVAVDDTDDLSKATSTGEIAELIQDAAIELGARPVFDITRHQLLISDDVPYTSHNSAMAFEVRMPRERVGELRLQAIELIARNRAATSDPGLCVAVLPAHPVGVAPDAQVEADCDALAAFGLRAKERFCPIESACALAATIPWVELSEHGGTGAGVVGALAGVGLRLGGADGRFRGRWDLKAIVRADDATAGMLARELAHSLRGPAQVVDAAGERVPDDTPVELVGDCKPILLDGALTVVCDVSGGRARPCAKVDLGAIGNERSWKRVCSRFTWDNDREECADDQPSCRNCLHRRWTARGFTCLLGNDEAPTREAFDALDRAADLQQPAVSAAPDPAVPLPLRNAAPSDGNGAAPQAGTSEPSDADDAGPHTRAAAPSDAAVAASRARAAKQQACAVAPSAPTTATSQEGAE